MLRQYEAMVSRRPLTLHRGLSDVGVLATGRVGDKAPTEVVRRPGAARRAVALAQPGRAANDEALVAYLVAGHHEFGTATDACSSSRFAVASTLPGPSRK